MNLIELRIIYRLNNVLAVYYDIYDIIENSNLKVQLTGLSLSCRRMAVKLKKSGVLIIFILNKWGIENGRSVPWNSVNNM